MVLGLYTKGRSSMKFKLPKMPKFKMPKFKMPDIVGPARGFFSAVGNEVRSGTKGAVKGLKGLNPFKK